MTSDSNNPILIRPYAGHAKYAASQAELEQIAQAEAKRQMLEQTRSAADRNYYTSTTHGRRLVRGSLDGVPVITLVAKEIVEKLTDTVHTNSHKGAKGVMECLRAFTAAEAEHPGYLGKGANGADLLALLAIKSIIDGFGATEGGKWPAYAGVAQRIGELADTQRVDALCLMADPIAHLRQSKRWSRKNQGVVNRHTNVQLGQRDILAAVGMDVRDLRQDNETRARMGIWLLERVTAATGEALFSTRYVEVEGQKKTKPSARLKAKVAAPREIRVVVPHEGFLQEFCGILEELTLGQVSGWPLIEPPKPWVFNPEVPGVRNTGGGFHTPAVQDAHPQVRTRFEDNATILSEHGVNLLNTLGRTALKADLDVIDAFEWGLRRRPESLDIKGLNPWPSETVADLDRIHQHAKAVIQETGLHPKGHAAGTQEQKAWRKEMRDSFNKAVTAEKKFARTRKALLATKSVKEFDRVWFSWSADYRGRVYSQQHLLQPQGPSVEKALLRLAQGEPLTAQGESRVFQAIGAAFRGTRRKHDSEGAVLYSASFACREQWGRDHIEEILQTMEGEPSDIQTIAQQWKAKEPWEAFQLVRGWQRYQQTGLWDVPVSADGSQSGTLLLAALLRDKKSLLHVNGLFMNLKDDGPEDGYLEVSGNALRLLDESDMDLDPVHLKWREQHPLPAVVRDQVRFYLEHDLARECAKAASMPRIYGSKHESTLEKIEGYIGEAIYEKVKEGLIPLPTEPRYYQGEEVEWTPWAVRQAILNGLTSYLRQAVTVTFPKQMAALDWLRALARKSIANQLKAGVKVPHLKWTLSDGTVVEYWRTKAETIEVRSVEAGSTKVKSTTVQVGCSDELDEREMLKAFAPGLVHSLDSLLLRIALCGWEHDVIAIHDCIRCHPNYLGELISRLTSGLVEVATHNSLAGFADQMGVTEKQLPRLTLGTVDVSLLADSRYAFH
jgi:hypothetical protein